MTCLKAQCRQYSHQYSESDVFLQACIDGVALLRGVALVVRYHELSALLYDPGTT